MTSGQIKFLTLIFALVNVWLVFHIPAVSEATLKFVSVGLIPGTDTTLSPNVMLYLAGAIFAMSFGLIFRREFAKLFRRKRASAAVVGAVQTSPIVQDSPVEPVAAKPVKRRTRRNMPVWPAMALQRGRAIIGAHLARTRLLLVAVGIAAGIRFAQAAARLRSFLRWAAARLVLAARQRWAWLRPRLYQLGTLLQRGAKTMWLLVRDGWRWLEPHIRTFDRWIERQLRSNDTTARLLRAGGTAGSRASVELTKVMRLARSVRDNARKAWRASDR